MPHDAPPDLFGIGKIIGVAAGVLFALRMVGAIRTWWGNRRRKALLQAARAAKNAADSSTR